MDNIALQDSLTRIVQSVDVAPSQIDLAFEQAKAALTTMWETTPDAGAQALIQTTWDQVHFLAQHNAQMAQLAKDATVAAIEINTKLGTALDNLDTQRNRAEVAEDDLGELREAITEVYTEGYTNHPELQDIIEVVTENIYNDGLHVDDPEETMMESGWANHVNTDMAQWVFTALFELMPDSLPAVLRDEFAQHINAAGELIFLYNEAMSQAAYVDLDAEPEVQS